MPDPKPTEPHDIDAVPISLLMKVETAALLMHAVSVARDHVPANASADYIVELERLQYNLRKAIVSVGVVTLDARNEQIKRANAELASLGLSAPALPSVSFTNVDPTRAPFTGG